MASADQLMIQAQVGVGMPPDHEKWLVEGPSLAPRGPLEGEIEA
jgi:hypothetical protein